MAYTMTPDLDPDANIGSMIFDALDVGVSGKIQSQFDRYVRSYTTDRWLIFSDYVLGQRERPNDVFAFTLMPGGDYFTGAMGALKAKAKRDFKDVKDVSEPMMELLRDPRLFSFCFIVDPSKRVTQNAAKICGMLERSIERLKSKADSNLRERDIKTLRAVRAKAASQGFNVRLFDNIVLSAAFAAFLTVLVCRIRIATRVGWFSDRDSIVSAHKAFAHYVYASNVVVFSERKLNGWSGPLLGVNSPVEPGGKLWCEAAIRVPDHLAGVVSAWNLAQHTIPEARKYRQIFLEGIADNPNIQLMRLVVQSNGDLISAYSQPISVKMAHPSSPETS
jgi:hypothetical protein